MCFALGSVPQATERLSKFPLSTQLALSDETWRNSVNSCAVCQKWADATPCQGKRVQWRPQCFPICHHTSSTQHSLFLSRSSADKLCRPRLQTGVVRTNCVDCLDRTNVLASGAATNQNAHRSSQVHTCFGPNSANSRTWQQQTHYYNITPTYEYIWYIIYIDIYIYNIFVYIVYIPL